MKTTKHLFLLCALVLASIGAMAQSQVALYGDVWNSSTFYPVPNHLVTVIDSNLTNSTATTYSIYTNANGQYGDTLTLNSSIAGEIWIMVQDCNNNTVSSSYAYTPNSPIYWNVNDTFMICVNSASNCNYTVAAQPNLVTPGLVQFTTNHQQNPINPSTYAWDFGDGTTDTGATVTHTYTAPGTYQYCLTVDSCTAVCDSITISQSPLCDASFTLTSSNLTAFINPVAAGQSGTLVFFWGDNTIDTIAANALPTIPYGHTYAAAGTYALNLHYIDANSNCFDYALDTVTVSATNPLNCNASFIVDTVNSLNGTVTLWNNSQVPIQATVVSNFYWNFGDGNTSTQAFPTHQYTNPGLYQVCLTVDAFNTATGDSCYSTFCDSLGMDANGDLIYKGTATGWQLVVLDPNSIGIEEDFLNQLSAYPNPVKDVLKIELPKSNTNASFNLYNTAGILVKSFDASAGQTEAKVSVADLPNGMYILQAIVNNTTKQIRLVKNN